MADRKAALAKARTAWNAFAALFNPASNEIARIPELKPVLDVFASVANPAIAGAPAITKAIADAGGLDPVPPMTPAEDARAKQLADQVATLLQAFEDETGLDLLAMTIDRSAAGKVTAGVVTLLR